MTTTCISHPLSDLFLHISALPPFSDHFLNISALPAPPPPGPYDDPQLSYGRQCEVSTGGSTSGMRRGGAEGVILIVLGNVVSVPGDGCLICMESSETCLMKLSLEFHGLRGASAC